MIYGDSGTGKDIVAREIHKQSKNNNGPFIALNAALMEPTNIENELFGSHHDDANIGYLELASNGTLFIDEVAEMPIQTQAKILRLLTDRYYTKVGTNNVFELKCRIICSSTNNLENLIDQGKFRRDLFHRLNVVTIKLPNLTDRIEDFDLLIDYFTSYFSKENNTSSSDLKPLIKSKYINYNWPGNVRELRNVIERYVILGEKL